MSKQADKLLADILPDKGEDGMEWELAKMEVQATCDVQENTSEQYIRRSNEAVIEETVEGDKIVKAPEHAGVTPDEAGTELVEQEVGKPTGEVFANLPILKDEGHPEIPRHARRGYVRRRMNPDSDASGTSALSQKTDVDVITATMDDGDFSTLLIGKHGIGKDFIIEHICAKTNRPTVRLVANDDPDFVDLLIGTYAPDEDGEWGRQKGLLKIAIECGYTFILDEFNSLSGKVQTMLNKLLEDSNKNQLVIPETNEVIEPHDEFCFVATMNPNEVGYGGREELDDATGSRFFPVKMPPLEASGERQVVANETHWNKNSNELQKLLGSDGGLIPGLRNLHYMGKLPTYISTRDAIQIGRMAEKLNDVEAGAETVLTGRVGPEHEETVRSEINDIRW